MIDGSFCHKKTNRNISSVQKSEIFAMNLTSFLQIPCGLEKRFLCTPVSDSIPGNRNKFDLACTNEVSASKQEYSPSSAKPRTACRSAHCWFGPTAGFSATLFPPNKSFPERRFISSLRDFCFKQSKDH